MKYNNKKPDAAHDNLDSDSLKTAKTNKVISYIEKSFAKLKEENLSYEETLKIINNILSKNYAATEDIILPASIFDNTILSSLELIVKYLHENLGLKFSKIAKLIGRNNVALANSYRIAVQKHPSKLVVKPSVFVVPCSILKNRKLSVLENISYYLKNNYKLTYHDVAVLLRKNDRTIWTVYQRALKKLSYEKNTN